MYVFDEELGGKLITEGPNEKEISYPGELGEGSHTVYDQANMQAEKQLMKTMFVLRPVTFVRVGMWTVGPSYGVIIRNHFGHKDTFARSGVYTEISEVQRTAGAYGKK